MSKLQNKEKTVGFWFFSLFFFFGGEDMMFFLPSSKTWSRGAEPCAHEAVPTPAGTPQTCCLDQRAVPRSLKQLFMFQTTNTYWDMLQQLTAFTTDGGTKQMFVGCGGGEKQTRQTVGWLHASLRLLLRNSLCCWHISLGGAGVNHV